MVSCSVCARGVYTWVGFQLSRLMKKKHVKLPQGKRKIWIKQTSGRQQYLVSLDLTVR